MSKSRSEEIRESYLKRQLTRVGELIVESIKESIQAHLVENGLSAEGAECLRVKQLGKTTADGIQIGLPQLGISESDYLVFDTFINSLNRTPSNGYDNFKVTVPEGKKLKTNVTLTAQDADQLVAVINHHVLPPYHVSMDAVREIRGQVIKSGDGSEQFDDLDYFIYNMFRSSTSKQPPKPEQPVKEPKKVVLTPFQQRILSRFAGGYQPPHIDMVPKQSTVALVAKQLRSEFIERLSSDLPRFDKDLVAKVVDYNFSFVPVDDMGVLKIKVNKTIEGIMANYDISNLTDEGVIWSRALPAMTELRDEMSDRRGKPASGTFGYEFFGKEPLNDITVSAKTIEDLANGINPHLRKELQVDTSQFLGRPKN